MTDKYNELVKLQKDTIGGSFTLSYSTKTRMHQVNFYTLKKRFDGPTPEQALDLAIQFVVEWRYACLGDLKYTLIKQ